ncbi:MAG TPA: hypothetical protein VMN60_02795 [Longimicrobiales bacterium]|nr:hypothetical protein [Longimicrobiales bacterium]
MTPLLRARFTTARYLLILLVAAAGARTADAQDTRSRLLATAGGTVAGVAGGGYIALTVIVAEARAGRYLHDMKDVLGWRSLPVIGGAAVGGGLGFYSPERLQGAVVYGAAGWVVGGLAGMGIGSALWPGATGNWAGAAIGAGVGLAIGNIIGILYPPDFVLGDKEEGGAGIPLMIIRIPLQ